MATSDHLLPSPRAGDAKGGKYQRDKGKKGKERPTLTGRVDKMLPTPTAQMAMQERMKRKQNDGSNRHALFLSDAIQSTSSRAGSRASLFPQPAEGSERQTIATSGQRCFESYENFIRGGSSVKMLAGLLLGQTEWYSSKCMLIWKVKVTKSKRLLFQLSPSARPIEGIGSGLLRTTQASDGTHGGPQARDSNGDPHLSAQIAMLPTPTDPKMTQRRKLTGGENRSLKTGQKFGISIQQVVEQMLPTPAAADGTGGKKHKAGTYSATGMTAKGKVQVSVQDRLQMLGTPRARDGNAGSKGSKGSKHNYQKGYLDGQIQEMPLGSKTGLKLQPAFALWMMGYRTDHLDLEAGAMPPSKARAMQSSPKSPRK